MLEDAGVALLSAGGHSATDVREGLMAIETAQLDVFAIEHEALRSETDFAEADAGSVFIRTIADSDVIELGRCETPESEVSEVRESDIEFGGFAVVLGGGGLQDAVAIAEFDSEWTGLAFAGEEAMNDEFRRWRENILRLGEDVFDVGLRDEAQGDFAIDAAEGEIVDVAAEGWDIGAFGGIELDGENVVAGPVEVGSEIEGERRVTAEVFRELVAVDGDGGGGHGAFEIDEDALALSGLGQAEVTAVDGGEFVGAVVKAVPREGDVGVWEGDAGEGGIVEIGCGAAWEVVAAEEPVTVHGVDAAG